MDSLCLPTLTPYRLLVLLVGLVIGTLKAAFSYQGKAMAPIALEWASGTLIFIMCFLLGLLEDAEHLPPTLNWFYNFDCAQSLLSYLQTGNTNGSELFRERNQDVSSSANRLPIVSGYNILLSLVVILFGLVKAILSYLAFSTEVTTIDWVFGVLLTTCLYFLGLYKDRGGAVFPSLFRSDYSQRVSSIMTMTLVQTLFYGNLAFSAWLTWTMFNGNFLKQSGFPPGPGVFFITPLKNMHDNAIRAMLILTLALLFIFTSTPSLIILIAFNRRFRYLLICYRAIRKCIMSIAAQIPPGMFHALKGITSSLSFRISRHIFIHVVMRLVPLSIIAFIFLGFAVRMMNLSLLASGVMASCTLAIAAFYIPVLKSLFYPLLYWKDETKMRSMLW